MSNTATTKIGNQDITLTTREVTARKREVVEGKNKMVETKHQIVAPLYKDLPDCVQVFTALLEQAEKTEAGNAVLLTDALLLDRITESSNEATNADTGDTDPEKYIAALSRHVRPRSAPAGKDSINAEIVALTPEMLELNAKARSADGWKSIVNPDGTPRFADEAEYLLRLDYVGRRMANLCTQLEALHKRNEQIQQKKKEKAAAAAAAVKSAAAAAVPGH